jgi:hypothetical protein
MAKKHAEIVKSQNSYDSILSELSELLEQSRRLTARSVNAIMTERIGKSGGASSKSSKKVLNVPNTEKNF